MRRKKLVSDKGHEFLVDLDEMKSVLSNQAFKLESGKLITIKSKKENLLKKAEEEAGKTDISDQSKYLADQKVQVLRLIN